jgi:uncharacterized membrane protein
MNSAIINRNVMLVLILASLLLGAVNNFLNTNRVDWVGSPQILPKPDDWPVLSAAEGARAGLQFAWVEISKFPVWVAGALLVLALGIAALRQSVLARRRWALSWWRVLFGVMFLAAAWPKFTDPEGFAMMVAQYQMLPSFAVNAFSVWLPAVEIITGLALLLSPWERETSVILGVLMVMFIVALGQALARNLGIACGCFDIKGATDAGESWFALLRDIVLLAPIIWMYQRAEHRFLWRF